MDSIVGIIVLILDIIRYTLLAQVILSWLVVAGVKSDIVTRLYSAVSTLTEPILAPIRRVLPRTGRFDFSVIAAFILILILRQGIASTL